MGYKHFTVKYPPLSEYDIPFDPGKIKEQQFADDAFMQMMFRCASKSKKHLIAFLNYQLGNCASQIQFIEHVDNVFKINYYKLNPYKSSIQVVLNWISDQKQIFGSISEVLKDKQTSNPPFATIVKDSRRMDLIVKGLINEGILSASKEWHGITKRSRKQELVALINILVEMEVIHNESKALLGRLFSREFHCQMNPRNFSVIVKDDNILKVKSALASIFDKIQ